MMRLFALLLILTPGLLCAAELPEVVDFNDHIQPLISDKCYHCHGPDSSTREPKKNPLRLDREEFAFLPRRNGQPTIIRGDAEASEFFKRIISQDPDDVMPTPESHKKPLNPEQIALIKKWIEQGAPYEEHWSFVPPVKPIPPQSSWGHNAVDAFIAAKHQEHALEPSEPQEPARLLRRLTFDLTGLPPTPEQVAVFRELAAQDLSTAVEMTVARLLGTDAYAEHFGRHWLDAARYADTHGIHIDNYRSIWPYRDWVIEAFRQNMPFDQFTREQLAGDLLPNPTLEQKIATGFNRCLPTTGEGGAIDKEYEAIYAADQVATTSAIWLGLSTGCAACHDHKFDPISQKDFYAMTAFFRNTTMAAMDQNKANHPPNIFAPRIEDRARMGAIASELTSIETELAKQRQNIGPDFKEWLAAQPTRKETELPPALQSDIALPLVVENQKLSARIGSTEQSFDFLGKTLVADGIGSVPSLNDLNFSLGDLFEIEARETVTLTGYLYLDGNITGPLLSRMDTTRNFRGWDLWLEGSRLGAHFIDSWPHGTIKAFTETVLESGKWHHFALIYDGNAPENRALTVYLDGDLMPLTYSHTGKVESLENTATVRLGGRYPSTKLTGDAALHNVEMFRRKLSPKTILTLSDQSIVARALRTPESQRTEHQHKTLYEHYLKTADADAQAIIAQRDALITEREMLRTRGADTLIMQEKTGEAFAHLLERGDYSLERERVPAAIPQIFGPPHDDRSLNRRDLADWLVSAENPLTARVTVNRLWYYFFGRGIVETTEDFGIMGASPTHPKLLDYLATELIDHDWNLQHIIKLITSSATYQQAAITTSANREKDSENKYLWRAPRLRLEAEQLRDMALATSGLLVRKIGGPSVRPYQPDGIWEAVAMKESTTRHYQADQGEGLYRRSLYTIWKRTAAPPNMEILNAPTREVFCVRRDRTNTPLAAFVTMNDTQFVEAARVLAGNALKSSNSMSQRLDIITMALMSRTLSNEEQAVVKQALDEHFAHYREHPKLADELLTVGEAAPDPSIPKPELAAWTLIASQIFNLDETLTK